MGSPSVTHTQAGETPRPHFSQTVGELGRAGAAKSSLKRVNLHIKLKYPFTFHKVFDLEYI